MNFYNIHVINFNICFSGTPISFYLDDLFKYRYSPWREFPQWKKDLLQRGADETRRKKLLGN
jgi:hypothetical protein